MLKSVLFVTVACAAPNALSLLLFWRADEISVEKINVLRSRLMGMKHELAKKQAQTRNHSIDDVLFNRPHRNASIIDANFLSVALCGLLCVILSVAVYAFYTLYHAVLKRFPSKHTEL